MPAHPPTALPAASPGAASTAPAGMLPVLHLGHAVTFADPQSAGDQGAAIEEKQTWKLTSYRYISAAVGG